MVTLFTHKKNWTGLLDNLSTRLQDPHPLQHLLQLFGRCPRKRSIGRCWDQKVTQNVLSAWMQLSWAPRSQCCPAHIGFTSRVSKRGSPSTIHALIVAVPSTQTLQIPLAGQFHAQQGPFWVSSHQYPQVVNLGGAKL